MIKLKYIIILQESKAGNDQLGVVQTKQDIGYCNQKFPQLSRSISAQFMDSNLIAMFELAIEESEVKIVQEKHYKLVPAHHISTVDLQNYRNCE